MSKQYNIRWRDSDQEELRRVIKNYNAKLYRISSKDKNAVEYLPPKINLKQAKEQIGTRADYNNLVNELKRFSKRGAEEPVKFVDGSERTKWQVQEYKMKEKRENLRRAKEKERLGEMAITSRGEDTGVKRKEMGRIKDIQLNPIKRNPQKMTGKEFDRAFENIDKHINSVKAREQKESFRDNYIRGLINNGFSEDLQKKIQAVDIDRFIDITATEMEANIDFIYSPLDVNEKEEQLSAIWGDTGENDR